MRDTTWLSRAFIGTLIVLAGQARLVADDQSAAPHTPKFKIELTRWGCPMGIGVSTVPPQKPEDERKCDDENQREFISLLGRCSPVGLDKILDFNPPPPELTFDADHDKCVTCNDYVHWKNILKEQFEIKQRSTDGSHLKVDQCDRVTTKLAVQQSSRPETHRERGSPGSP